MGKALKYLFSVNLLSTLLFNFRYFSVKTALRFPVILSGRVSFNALKGNVSLKGPVKTGMIRFGEDILGIHDKRISTVFNIHGNLWFLGKARFGRGVSISVGNEGTLQFGRNLTITGKSTIVASGKKSVTFGDGCLISWDVLIMNTDFHNIFAMQNQRCLNEPKDVFIGNHVWIGCRSTILKGTVLPDHSVIGANTVISKALEKEHTIYAGVPVKSIKNDIYWER